MPAANEIISLSSRAFWDVEMNALDYEQNASYIIRKVFEYGTLGDVAEVSAYYGRDRVKAALLGAPYLMEKTLWFASTLFDVPVSEFKCFITKQYHPLS